MLTIDPLISSYHNNDNSRNLIQCVKDRYGQLFEKSFFHSKPNLVDVFRRHESLFTNVPKEIHPMLLREALCIVLYIFGCPRK